jgi:hypothetical protein
MHYISILSTVVVLFFVVAVFNRYSQRGGVHLLLWGIGLVFYGLGTFSEAVMLFTFDPWILKLWYFSGAMMTAAWLGQGSIHLLVRKRGVAPALTGLLLVVSLISAYLIVSAPVVGGAAAAYDLNLPASGQYHDILERNSAVVALTIILNIYGTVALVGGALYSAFLFWRKQVLLNRMLGNILIAAGALMPAMGGSFIKAGLPDWLYLSEFLGAILMFAGFIKATASQKVREGVKAPIS